ncbi:MAG: hypothetical protein DME87_02055, partial [Verrucomicrobia bacterium]
GNHSFSERRRILNPNGICVMAGIGGAGWHDGILSRLAGELNAYVRSRFVSQKFISYIAQFNKKDMMVLALYRLFKAVNQKHALAMATLMLISIPISLFNVLNEIAALVLASGTKFLSVFETPQLDALAYLFLRLHGQGFVVAQIFWGLWLFPFGIVVIRSDFIPRVLGVLLFIAGFGNVASSFCSLLPGPYAPVIDRFASVLTAAELPIIFWLLIWGAKDQSSGRQHSDLAAA